MLSVTCKAAIKAVIVLGSKAEAGDKLSIREIAGQIDESEHTVAKLLQKLVREGIINSSKGPTGGFFMTAKQKNQPVLVIVEAIDGTEVFNQCGLGLHKCSALHPCPIHNVFKSVREGFKKICEQNTIGNLCKPVNQGVAYLVSG